MATVPPRIGELSPYGGGWAADYTLAFNLVRTPAAVVPAGFVSDGGDSLPIGLQIVAPRGCDLASMRAAGGADAALGFSARRRPFTRRPGPELAPQRGVARVLEPSVDVPDSISSRW